MDGPFGNAARAPFSHVALIGNALPRMCGIATYSSHLFNALRSRFPTLVVDYYAMNDPGRTYDYPPIVTGAIRQEEIGDYAAAAAEIEASGAELAWVQHEFGIFGGPAGAHLLELVERLTIPVAITLHTIIEQPDPDQRAVMERLIRAATRLIVMAQKGRDILTALYGVPERKIAVIPHGVPDRAYIDPDAVKPRFGLAGRKVLLTFGLLSPGKGIETMIEAMPAILAACPEAVYVIAGATHPHLVAREGEAYRKSLEERAARLGVAESLRWIEGFLDQDGLLDLIAAADLYVTPYPGLGQISSGTLAYAVALGKPVISTPYHHAREVVGPDIGLLVSPGRPDEFAAAARRLLGDTPLRETMARKAYALGRTMLWSANVAASMATFAAWREPAFRGAGQDERAPAAGAFERT